MEIINLECECCCYRNNNRLQQKERMYQADQSESRIAAA